MDLSPQRVVQLNKVFNNILFSKESTLTAYNASPFLDALAIQSDAPACVDKIFASKHGLDAIQKAFRTTQTPTFYNNQIANALAFFQDPDLKLINGGAYLNDIVVKITDPPIFWRPYRAAFLNNQLNSEKSQTSFGWLFLQLCCLPAAEAAEHRTGPDTDKILRLLTSSEYRSTRTIGQKLKQVLATSVTIDNSLGPIAGGRHNNDFEDFRKISILPTSDELQCTEPAFLRPASMLEDPATADTRVAMHLDNQFRLNREDMICEMKDEIQIIVGKKNAFRQREKIKGFKVVGLECGQDRKRNKWAIVVECLNDLQRLKSSKGEKKRKAYLTDHRNYIKHQSLAALFCGQDIVGFPTINRDEDRLAQTPPQMVLQFDSEDAVDKAIIHFTKNPADLYLVPMDVALFSYEPILRRLKNMNVLPLSDELLLWKEGDPTSFVDSTASNIVRALELNPQVDLQPLLKTSSSIKLDSSQAKSLLAGLVQRVSLIQGPPGTGKSFIGALLAKAIFDHTAKTILVVCYTNHALDDILTSLINIGIPQASMLRLGGKSTPITEPLTMQRQNRPGGRSRDQWTVIDKHKDSAEKSFRDLTDAFINTRKIINAKDYLPFLEFEFPDYFAAFQVPESDDGMSMVDRKGQAIGESYLFDQWVQGYNGGAFPWISQDLLIKKIWDMPKPARQEMRFQWNKVIYQGLIEDFVAKAVEYNNIIDRIKSASSNVELFRSKRIVGCTTTAAAKYSDDIQAFNPDVLLVEEAGEILESHVLTSLGPEASQLILIGDHKQLRPKVNNYNLTIEKGEGYDLNRSLFERLIIKNFPHSTLREQHRMRPEISSLIRHLTYPDLIDAPKTQNRPDILGLQDNIVFIDHDHPEDENTAVADKRDGGATSSKQNSFEARMILKIVKYLGQQGYGTSHLVILTPYLAQLHNLRDALKADTDPILNDLDSADLIKAGLINPSEAKLTKKPIRLATIDNYQGEESDIVIASLTRSNPRHDIGFMFSPERLNVLLSRARDGLIIIGNMDTFMNARNAEGKKLWTELFSLLRDGKHIYEGFPIKCEQHPDKISIIKDPKEFEEVCPDGGCDSPCGVSLSCGIHKCPSKCHQLVDHSKMPCNEIIDLPCPNGHPRSTQCSKPLPTSCRKCDREAKLARERLEREAEEKRRQEAEQQRHLERMDALEAQIVAVRQAKQDALRTESLANAIKQKEADLADMLAARSSRATTSSTSTLANQSFNSISTPSTTSEGNTTSSITTSEGDTTNSIMDMLPPVSGLFGRILRPFQQQSGHEDQTPAAKETAHPDATMDGRDSPTGPVSSSAAKGHGRSPVVPVAPIPGRVFPQLAASPSSQEWDRRKQINGLVNASIDSIMGMTGLEEVKKQVLQVLDKIEATTRQNASLAKERFNVVLLGNPGTGKTTIARHYAAFLASMKVTPGTHWAETTGSRLANEGVNGAKKIVEAAVTSGGGTIFIDEAYQLTSAHNHQGGAVLDFLLAEMENNIGTLIFILAGYDKEMEKFFEHNPGLKSRIPYQFHFADYKDEELMSMFENMVKRTFTSGPMKMEGGYQGLYSRIVIRRLSRCRGRPGFGNARDLENALQKIRSRQATRLAEERKSGRRPDDFFFTKEDLIGREPASVFKQSKAWLKLQSLIGLQSVKESVKALANLVDENYKRELMEKEPIEMSLNKVFLGSPGTGKTTVAKIYGQILVELGMLSSSEVLVKNPADFVGAHIGESEKNTKGILSNAMGKVLIIDEAYMLHTGGGDNEKGGGHTNQFKTSVIDTIVAEVQSVPGEDRCVILVGYTDEMTEMFRSVNPGLARRFKIEDAFKFEDFTESELSQILDNKLKDQDLGATPAAKKVAIKVLLRMKNKPNFGNAGEVENIIGSAKTRCVSRRASNPPNNPDIIFEPEDFDPEYNRGANASSNIASLFADIVGREDVLTKLRNFQDLAIAYRSKGLDPSEEIPMNFVFTGPPGTGKTTIARKVGQVFYDMDLLASPEVVECSASDLIGQYIGHTGPKTKKLFERGLGKVLFIDEAYRLSHGHFAQEAIDEIVGLITQPKFKGKLVIILAGYERDMNNLMTVNSGLNSRFPERITFDNMHPEDCLKIVKKELMKKNIKVKELEDPALYLYDDMVDLIRELSALDDWGNARDMITFSKELVGIALLKDKNDGSPNIVLDGSVIVKTFQRSLDERRKRAMTKGPKRQKVPDLPVQADIQQPPPPPPPPVTSTASKAAPPAPKSPPPQEKTRPDTPASVTSNQSRDGGGARGRSAIRGRGRGRGSGVPMAPAPAARAAPTALATGDPARDAGVSDAVWNALCKAKQAAIDLEREAVRTINRLAQEAANQRKKEKAVKDELARIALEEAKAIDAARRLELQRQREQARLREHAARVAAERAAAVLAAKRAAEKQRKEQEERAQQKLRQMGVCVAGFRWIKQSGGYRCAGGSHWVSDAQLGV